MYRCVFVFVFHIIELILWSKYTLTTAFNADAQPLSHVRPLHIITLLAIYLIRMLKRPRKGPRKKLINNTVKFNRKYSNRVICLCKKISLKAPSFVTTAFEYYFVCFSGFHCFHWFVFVVSFAAVAVNRSHGIP